MLPSRPLFLSLAACLLPLISAPLRADEESTVVPVPKVTVLPPAKDWITSLAFSADGKTLAIGTKESVSLFDIEKRTSRATLSGIKGQVRALAFSPDGSQLAVGCYQSVQL